LFQVTRTSILAREKPGFLTTVNFVVLSAEFASVAIPAKVKICNVPEKQKRPTEVERFAE
jgi:hypothetical protein